MTPTLETLRDLSHLELAVAASFDRPLVIFKHSRSCGTSHQALDALQEHLATEPRQATYVMLTVQEQRDARYNLLRGYFHGADDSTFEDLEQERLTTITLPLGARTLGRALSHFALHAQGVRVVNMRSAGTLDSRVFKQAIEQHPEIMAPIQQAMTNDTMLKRMPLMQEVANAAVFLCSPMASAITGVTVDLTAGTTAGFNYKVSG